MKKKPRSPSTRTDEERAKRKARRAAAKALNADIDAVIAANLEAIKAAAVPYYVVSAAAAEISKKHSWSQGSVNIRFGRRYGPPKENAGLRKLKTHTYLRSNLGGARTGGSFEITDASTGV